MPRKDARKEFPSFYSPLVNDSYKTHRYTYKVKKYIMRQVFSSELTNWPHVVRNSDYIHPGVYLYELKKPKRNILNYMIKNIDQISTKNRKI